MSSILCIETSTSACSVALSQDGANVFDVSYTKEAKHATILGGYIDQALSYAKEHDITIDAVAVSSGPGSYTGLRIGVSMAKGICYALQIPLISIPTLELLCVPLLLQVADADQARFVPMLDARRMEIYTAVYDFALTPIEETNARVIEENNYLHYLDAGPVYFIGNGVEKCQEILKHPNAHFFSKSIPSAKWMHPLAERKLIDNKTEDVAYFEPFYLKEFVATVSKKKLL